MSTQKFQVKLYALDAADYDVDRVIPVFHSFIQKETLGEFVLDVADYGHVHHGPGVVLIGHGSDYYLDQREGRVGLLYSRKRDGSSEPEASLEDAVRRVLRAAAALEADSSLGLRFGLAEVVVRVNDRTNTANDDASFAALRDTVTRVVGKAVGAEVSASREGEPRELLTIRVRGGGGSVTEALARVG